MQPTLRSQDSSHGEVDVESVNSADDAWFLHV